MSELIGRELGSYRILEQIGVGGMATVYKAYHPPTDRTVAIKVLPELMGANEELRHRFQREAKVIARMEHAHIMPVHDSGQSGSLLYLVMRYMDAGTLRDRIAAGGMDLAEINRVMQQVGQALDYAHQLGVIHRDVKPSNVLLDEDGNCYLTDFGLARLMEASIKLTATGVGLGTPAYMSPEQGQGDPADARSDIYSMGVMLYEMVTGRVPYEAETPLAIVLKHITAPLPLPRELDPDIAPSVERVILKAMAKDPADRFQSAGEMTAALDAAVQDADEPFLSDEAFPWTGEESAARPQWRRFALWGGIGAAVLVGLVLLFAWGLPAARARQEEQGTATAAAMVALTPSATVTQAPTETHTPAPTATVTNIPTKTSVPTGTPTPIPTSTETPTETPVPTPTVTRTPTATVPPTATYTPTPSSADLARAFADPILAAIAGRSPTYQDDFSNPGSGWKIETSDRGQIGYKDGKYFVLSTNPASAYGDWQGAPVFSDFVVEVDVQVVSGGQNPGDSWVLILRDWREPNPPPYGFYGVDGRPQSGEATLHVWGSPEVLGDHTVRLLPFGQYPLKRGYETNHVLVVLKGPQMALYVNGQPVGLGYHDLWPSGNVGLMASISGETSLEVHFDNLKIWDISNLP